MKRRFAILVWMSLLLPALLIAPRSLAAGSPKAKYQVLYSFQGQPDGANPRAGLIVDTNGTLYGTTRIGGSSDAGSVFALDPSGKETILHSFAGSSDGCTPDSGLVEDSSGNLYGTTPICGAGGVGTVFKINVKGAETVLYSFCQQGNFCPDGANPEASVVLDSGGNIYGTTRYGGKAGCDGAGSCGTVFKLAPNGIETVFHYFQGGADGAGPVSNLIFDPAGNLYGTAYAGGRGCGSAGCGVVYKLDSSGNETVLYRFKGPPDGAYPAGGLTLDGAGNLYGTTSGGGNDARFCRGGCGTVFKLTPSGKETVLYRFRTGAGKFPQGAVIRDQSGNLYGTTPSGGRGGGDSCCGLVFRLSTGGRETILYRFQDRGDGNLPAATLLRDGAGNLYGTAWYGGSRSSCQPGCGTVFKLTP